MKLLTNSKNLIEELKKIHIERSEELIEYLPYRYESFDYTDENELEDGQRVVLLGRIVSNPRHVKTNNYDIITLKAKESKIKKSEYSSFISESDFTRKPLNE